MSPTLGIVSWGRRGAAVRLTFTTAALLQAADIPFCLSVSSGFEDLSAITRIYPATTVVPVPASRVRMLVSPRLARRAARMTVDAFIAAGVTRAVVLMPHPWDLSLFRALRQAGIEVFQFTHDARPHPGELWPRQRDIDLRMQRADVTVFLTRSVADLGQQHAQRWVLAPHPAITLARPSAEVAATSKVPTAIPRQVLFIGRIRPYKGLDRLLAAWPLVATSDTQLVIAGEGRLPASPPPPHCRFINRWLSDPEIEDLIRGADVVVLPYSEASQSGITVIAREVGTPVVTTPLPGLLEQYQVGIDGLAAASMDPADLATAIDEVLARSWNTTDNNEANALYVDALINSPKS